MISLRCLVTLNFFLLIAKRLMQFPENIFLGPLLGVMAKNILLSNIIYHLYYIFCKPFYTFCHPFYTFCKSFCECNVFKLRRKEDTVMTMTTVREKANMMTKITKMTKTTMTTKMTMMRRHL